MKVKEFLIRQSGTILICLGDSTWQQPQPILDVESHPVVFLHQVLSVHGEAGANIHQFLTLKDMGWSRYKSIKIREHIRNKMSLFFLTSLTTIMALENVALNKPAQQVSEYQNYYAPAGKAVDGNTDGNFGHGSCTHTKTPEGYTTTWWKVDLMGFYKVTSVEIFARTDCCNKLQKFEVRVSLTNPVKFPSNEGQQCFNRTDLLPASGLYVNCTQPIIGRYVSLYKATLEVLSICELRVFADKAVSGCFQSSSQQASAAANSVTTCVYSLFMDNSRAVGKVYKSFESVSAARCSVKCAQTDNCFAFNFKTSRDAANSSVTCELLLGFSAFVPTDVMSVTHQNGWKVFALRFL
ncbi:uncharacterized protein LOC112554225 [Pomacea canaliculata]|uniref:uncharacterized protein LOC112554225 n=1 Tax=Pomacea canaliculata TaxID=400727 RepID=UPI000D7357F8|nr:uncharacterized protein LOC112554225 [Pomacea canaliculata]